MNSRDNLAWCIDVKISQELIDLDCEKDIASCGVDLINVTVGYG